MHCELLSRSVDDTLAIGEALISAMPTGIQVCLLGQLGGGKTHLVKGMVLGLGGNPADVTSPTFTLLQSYHTQSRSIHHIDLYRLEGESGIPREIAEIIADPASTACIEWADLFEADWPERWLEVDIEHGGDDQRRLAINAHGFDASDIEAALKPWMVSH